MHHTPVSNVQLFRRQRAMPAALAALVIACLFIPACTPAASSQPSQSQTSVPSTPAVTATATPATAKPSLSPTATPGGAVRLVPGDFNYYHPSLSIVSGLTMEACDEGGYPIAGDWSASWGDLWLDPLDGGTWVAPEGKLSTVLWNYDPRKTDLPETVTVTFTAGDRTATTFIELGEDGLYRVHEEVREAPIVRLSADVTEYSVAHSQAEGVTFTARDSAGNPVKGNWEIGWGGFRTASGSPALSPVLVGVGSALWQPSPTEEAPNYSLNIVFTRENWTYLSTIRPSEDIPTVFTVEIWDDMKPHFAGSLATQFWNLQRANAAGSELQRFLEITLGVASPDRATELASMCVDVLEAPLENCADRLVRVAERSEQHRQALLALVGKDTRSEATKTVLQDDGFVQEYLDMGYVLTLSGGMPRFVPRYRTLQALFGDAAGPELQAYLALFAVETEQPLAPGTEPIKIAQRYEAAVAYLEQPEVVSKARRDRVEQYRVSCLAAILTNSGRLYDEKSLTVPPEQQQWLEALCTQTESETPETDGILKNYRSMLEKAGWKLTSAVRKYAQSLGVALAEKPLTEAEEP